MTGIIYRGPPYDDGSSSSQPWISGQGAPLTEAQYDGNNYYLLSLIDDIQSSMSSGDIDYFRFVGSPPSIYVHLTNHTVLGPYDLDLPGFATGGTVGQVFVVTGAGGSGYPTGGYETFYLENLADWHTTTPLLDGQVATWNSTLGAWTNETSTAADYNESSPLEDGQVLTYDSGLGAYTNETPTPPAILQATVRVSSAELLALDGAPIEIIPAPGANTAIVIEQVMYTMVFGTTPYSGGSPENTAGLFYGTGLSTAADQGDGQLPTVTQSELFTSFGTENLALSSITDQPVYYGDTGSGYAAGDGELIITVWYGKIPTA